MTRILPADLDYTARDFDALNDRLQRSTESVFPNWSDKERSNFGNILREMFCFVGDVVAFYQDALAVESRFTTCTRRINGVRHARALGYIFRRQQAATVDCTITLAAAMAGKVTIPKGSIIRSASATNPIRVQTLADAEILAGTLQATVSCEHSLSWTTGFESSDLADQEFVLPQTPFLSLVSCEDSVEEFEEVSNFLNSGPTDSDLVILLSEDDKAKFKWGDGNQGRVPSGQVSIEYKTGGGAVTIDPNTLTVPEFSLQDEFGTPAVFSVANQYAASGGVDRESLAEAQSAAPAQVRVNQRSVTWDDYRVVAEGVSGVARAIILTSDQMSGIAENYGQLYIVAKGTKLASGAYSSATPSSALLTAVESAITGTYKPTITFQFDTIAAVFHQLNITARVRLEQGASPATVDAAIRTALEEFFAPVTASGVASDVISFGFEYKDELGNADPRILWSDLFGTILNVSGVRSVDEDTFVPADDEILALNEFPTLGTVTLINDRTGNPLV